ncbi:MAG: COQ9 family protein [Alphaproteobacteria bacterium]|nr:COQ9 family protein [Alphaproteobacteria bacterium]
MLEAEKDAILQQALRHVPFDGWGDAVLARAVADAGFDPVMAYRAFPDGVGALVDHFCATADHAMLAALEADNLMAMRIRDRIATAVRRRIEYYAPHREAVRRMLAFYALPSHAGRGMKRLYSTVNEMWYAAGDTATDFNFYSKRALLAGVYSSTLLFWLGDESEGYAATWEFLDRRIDNVMQIQKFKGKAKEGLGRMKKLWFAA